MIFAVSVQQHLEEAICPEIITKGQTPSRAMLLLVIVWGYQSTFYKGGIFDFLKC